VFFTILACVQESGQMFYYSLITPQVHWCKKKSS